MKKIYTNKGLVYLSEKYNHKEYFDRSVESFYYEEHCIFIMGTEEK